MNTTTFFETAIFLPQVEFSKSSEPQAGTRAAGANPNRVKFLVNLKAVSFVAATLLLSHEVVSSSDVYSPAAVMREAQHAGAAAAAPLGMVDDLAALRERRPLVRTADTRELARQASERLMSRHGESIDAWAQRIALDVANASD